MTTHQTTFTCQTIKGGRVQVRMEGRLIAAYKPEDLGLGDPHRCALATALAKRYAGDQGLMKPVKIRHRKSIYTVETPG